MAAPSQRTDVDVAHAILTTNQSFLTKSTKVTGKLESTNWTEVEYKLFKSEYIEHIPPPVKDYRLVKQAAITMLYLYSGIMPFEGDKYLNACLILWQSVFKGKQPNQKIIITGTKENVHVPLFDDTSKRSTRYEYAFSVKEISHLHVPSTDDAVAWVNNELDFWERVTVGENATPTEMASAKSRKLTLAALSLETFRLLIKDPPSVQRHILQNLSVSMAQLNPTSGTKFLPPCFAFFQGFSRDFNLSNYRGKTVILACAMLLEDGEVIKRKGAVLRATLFTPLLENGLGLITWPSQAAHKLGISVREFFLKYTLDSWKDSVLTAIKYMNKELHPTWPLCRLMVETAMAECATSQNLLYCMICARICLDDSFNLMDIAQFKKGNVHLNEAERAGTCIITMNSSLSNAKEVFPESAEFRNTLQNFHPVTQAKRVGTVARAIWEGYEAPPRPSANKSGPRQDPEAPTYSGRVSPAPSARTE